MKINGGGGVLWVCCLFTASVVSIESAVVSSIANLSSIVGGHLASWWIGLALARIHLECFQLAFLYVRVVCKEGCFATLPRGKKSGRVIT